MKHLLTKMLGIPMHSLFVGMPRAEVARQLRWQHEIEQLFQDKAKSQLAALSPLEAVKKIDRLGLPRYSLIELAQTGAHADRDRIDYSEADIAEAGEERRNSVYKK